MKHYGIETYFDDFIKIQIRTVNYLIANVLTYLKIIGIWNCCYISVKIQKLTKYRSLIKYIEFILKS
jgi:hypothetical protein